MVELREKDPDCFARGYAGDVYNTAVYLKRSLPAAQVQLLTATGDDALSDAMRASWRSECIEETLAFRVSGGTPGLYMIETDAAGERRFHYWRRDSAARRWWALLAAHGEAALMGADILLPVGHCTRDPLARRSRPGAIAAQTSQRPGRLYRFRSKHSSESLGEHRRGPRGVARRARGLRHCPAER